MAGSPMQGSVAVTDNSMKRGQSSSWTGSQEHPHGRDLAQEASVLEERRSGPKIISRSVPGDN